MLFDPHDVDDAVQAVFLVLVRKARTIRIEDSLGPWLYTVAGRVAARARANRRKQWARESFKDIPPEPSYSSTAGNSEIPVIIHDELGRLPERLRAPLVLCYLEGLTHDLAARQLDCPVGTVRSRLARARDLLHRRIIRRGLTLTAAAAWRRARIKRRRQLLLRTCRRRWSIHHSRGGRNASKTMEWDYSRRSR